MTSRLRGDAMACRTGATPRISSRSIGKESDHSGSGLCESFGACAVSFYLSSLQINCHIMPALVSVTLMITIHYALWDPRACTYTYAHAHMRMHIHICTCTYAYTPHTPVLRAGLPNTLRETATLKPVRPTRASSTVVRW